jgi:very-short-patch-repair endonuclease
MAWESAQRAAWALAKRQHWVITRQQLLRLGFSGRAIDLRIQRGRLHRIHAGVFAVGRPTLTQEGYFIAAVLACGEHALLSHMSAAVHWRILRRAAGSIHVTVPAGQAPRRPGITVHRRAGVTAAWRDGIPLTSVVDTIVDIAPGLSDTHLERAINEAVNRDLVDPERLRAALPRGRVGAPRLARLLDRDTYVTTDTILEQHMARIALRAGLPKPKAQLQLGTARVDFVWPELKLIVEADSLRFHRTTLQQRADGLRDQRHAAGGFLPLRFTHYQIMFEPDHVERTIRAVVANRRRPDVPGAAAVA